MQEMFYGYTESLNSAGAFFIAAGSVATYCMNAFCKEAVINF